MVIILFVPIRRYSLPASLPFNLEPYRIAVGLLIAAWFMTALIDRRVTFRRSGLEAPLFTYLFVIVLSLIANTGRVNAVGTFAVKNLTFLVSYVIVLYVFISLMRTALDIDFFVRLLVAGGGILGFFALVEETTHVDVFNHLQLDPSDPQIRRRVGADRSSRRRLAHLWFGRAPDRVWSGLCASHPTRDLLRKVPWAGALVGREHPHVSRPLHHTLPDRHYDACRDRGRLPDPAAARDNALLARPDPTLLAIHLAAPGALGSIKQAFLPRAA